MHLHLLILLRELSGQDLVVRDLLLGGFDLLDGLVGIDLAVVAEID